MGLDRKKQRLVYNTEYLMMEEFMQAHGIENSQDLVGPMESTEQAQKHRDLLTKLLVLKFHGSLDPRVVGIVRNTSLFEPRGMAMGDFDGDLGSTSLMQFYYDEVITKSGAIIGRCKKCNMEIYKSEAKDVWHFNSEGLCEFCATGELTK